MRSQISSTVRSWIASARRRWYTRWKSAVSADSYESSALRITTAFRGTLGHGARIVLEDLHQRPERFAGQRGAGRVGIRRHLAQQIHERSLQFGKLVVLVCAGQLLLRGSESIELVIVQFGDRHQPNLDGIPQIDRQTGVFEPSFVTVSGERDAHSDSY